MSAALIELQHRLERFNDSIYGSGHAVDLGRYVLPLFLVYCAFSFVPTFVATARQAYGARRILLLNAAAPAALFLACLLFSYVAVDASLEALVALAILCAGAVSWISTLIDATTAPPRRKAELG